MEENMGRTLIGCIVADAVGVALCGALLIFYPKSSGFTLTTPSSTHCVPGGELICGVLLCVANLVIGIYLAWSLTHWR